MQYPAGQVPPSRVIDLALRVHPMHEGTSGRRRQFATIASLVRPLQVQCALTSRQTRRFSPNHVLMHLFTFLSQAPVRSTALSAYVMPVDMFACDLVTLQGCTFRSLPGIPDPQTRTGPPTVIPISGSPAVPTLLSHYSPTTHTVLYKKC